MLKWLKSKISGSVKTELANALIDPRWWDDIIAPIHSSSGEMVTERTAMQVAAVFASVRVLSNGVSSLPLSLIKKNPRGVRSVASEHPYHKLIHDEPNPDMDACQFWRTIVHHMALRGHGTAFKVNTRSGRTTELRILHPDQVRVKRDDQNRIIFQVSDNGRMREYGWDSILHFPLFSDDGVTGVSPIRQCMNSVGVAMAADRFGASFLKNAMRPSMILETDNVIGGNINNPNRETMIKQMREQFAGAMQTGRPILAEHGMKYKPISINPDEAQFLETREFEVREIARIMGVPPHKIADLADAHHSNIEEQNIDWVNDGLMPYIVTIERGLRRQLLSEREKTLGYFAKFNTNALLRGNMTARSAFYHQQRQDGVLSANEIREMEDMNPQSGNQGDTYWMPVNMADASEPVTRKQVETGGNGNGSQSENSNGNGRMRTNG